MEFSSVKGSRAVFGLVVGWDAAGAAHRVVDLESGRELLVGERGFESDPWWREVK